MTATFGALADYRGPTFWNPETDHQPVWEVRETGEEYETRCWFDAVTAAGPDDDESPAGTDSAEQRWAA